MVENCLLKDLSLEELHAYGLTFPVHTEEYSTIQKEIRDRLGKESKYDEYIVCFNSKLFGSLGNESNYDYMFGNSGAASVNPTILNADKSIPELFQDEVMFMKRNMVEYNIEYKQLCVGLIIKLGDKYVLLQNTDKHRLANKVTMIQGHVDFSDEIYRMSFDDYLKRTAAKELVEEVDGFDDIKDTLPKIMIGRIAINDKFGDSISLEHVGVVYTLHLPATYDITKLTSREPEKHTLRIFTEDELESIETKDRWLTLVLDKLKLRLR